MDVQLRQLRAFVAVVDEGTFTDAALLLGVSQAAVSRSVAALETTLGTRLLDRSNQRVTLTGAGGRIVNRARRVLDEVDRLERIAQEARPELRVGYAYAALGKHTRHLMKAWAVAHPAVPLMFVQSNTPTAGLSEGIADIAVIRRALVDERFDMASVGCEARYAAVDTEHPLARRRSVRLEQLARYTVAIDKRSGTTTPELWPATTRPRTKTVDGVDEWLTVIAGGQAIGVTAEATANQNPRPGVAYRLVTDAPRIDVRLAWWKDDPPPCLDTLLAMIRELYTAAPPGLPRQRVPMVVPPRARGRH
ncbi:LysR family transcriptional regulator [Nonomuraea sp. NPDC049421]|uniref:LysR family transcriptional regulator n=1 Tax=Nonomuraea sp. NPDC049421 TaxID=3155275 RepID=UPI0034310124